MKRLFLVFAGVVCLVAALLNDGMSVVAQGTFNLPKDRQPITAENVKQITELAVLKGPNTDGIASIALSSDGSTLAYGSYGEKDVYVVDAATGKEIRRLKGHTTPVTGLAFSPDGSLLASTGTVNLPPSKDGSIRLWDIKTGKQLAVMQTNGVRKLAFSPDGKVLASASGANPLEVVLWDAKTGARRKVFSRVFVATSFSADGKLLASGSRDNLLHIWDVASGKENTALRGHTGWVGATAFSPDNALIASGSDDKTVRLWDVKTGKEVKVLNGHKSSVGDLAFSPDSKLLASLGSGTNITRNGNQVSIGISSADKIVRFWDIEAGAEIASLKTDKGIADVAFSENWSLVVTGDSGGVIRLWGVVGGDGAGTTETPVATTSPTEVAVASSGEIPGIDTPLKVQNGTIQVKGVKHTEKLDMGGGFEVKARSGSELVLVAVEVTGNVPLAGTAQNGRQDGKWSLVDTKKNTYRIAGLVSGAFLFEVKKPLQGLVLQLGDQASIPLDRFLK